MGRTRRDHVRYEVKGISGCWSIAKETLESAYSWDREGDRKTEEVGIGDKVE